jgi:tRNA modification GTPase
VTRLVSKHTSAPIIGLLTKADLVTDREQLTSDVLPVSARTGEGLSELLEAIDRRLAADHGMRTDEMPGLTRARHRVAVANAVIELEAFLRALEQALLPMSITATHVHQAADALGELIGVLHTDDVLDVVFRHFCVGK